MKRFIRFVHGQVTILDRKELESAACDCYPVIRALYDRVKTSRLNANCHPPDRRSFLSWTQSERLVLRRFASVLQASMPTRLGRHTNVVSAAARICDTHIRLRHHSKAREGDWLRVVVRPLLVGDARVSKTDIAHRTYDLFVARGREHGHDLDDWLQAERELQFGCSTDDFRDTF